MRGKPPNSCMPAVLTLQQALAQVAVTESREVVGLRFHPRCLRAAFDGADGIFIAVEVEQRHGSFAHIAAVAGLLFVDHVFCQWAFWNVAR